MLTKSLPSPTLMTFPDATDSAENSPAQHSADLALLKEAVREAGQIALRFFGRSPEVEIKPDDSPVSEADIAVDRALREKLMAARPGYGWLSEESVDDQKRLQRERIWVVDPIDGTRAFLKELPEWTIAAALVEAERPVIGIVFNPATGEFFEAEAGRGSLLNGKPISVRDPVPLENSELITSRSLLNRKIWQQPWPPLETRWVNSVAYRLALVASGECDATLSMTRKHDWDLAAAELLVQEAGGRATTHTGGGFRYNQPVPLQQSVIAAGPGLHAELLKRTRTAAI